ncbi:DUF2341 domain-containing protein [Sunxiuqinia indica]|uniref:DUF2341 domain-containing protein n=1 Tax=Sunxiuqinia indica TaxID=2692584 RepID=UPI001357A887|nr:DUF2341 domain-containing protein [Sunxiuqinia indica]
MINPKNRYRLFFFLTRYFFFSVDSSSEQPYSCGQSQFKIAVVIFSFIILVLFPLAGFSASYSSVQSGDWNDPATWGGSGIPVSGDDVRINSGDEVTYSGDLNWTSGIISGNIDLIVTGDFSMSGGAFSVWSTLSVQVGGDFTYSIGSFPMNNGYFLQVDGSFTSTTGGLSNNSTNTITIGENVTVDGDIILNNGAITIGGNMTSTNGKVEVNNNSSLTIGGDLQVASSIKLNNGTLYVDGNSSATSLEVNNGSTFFSGQDLAIGNSIAVNGGVIDVNGGLSTSDITLNNRSIIAIDGDLIKDGNITINSGSSNLVVAGSFVSRGGGTTIYNNGGFYVFQVLDETSSQANCQAGCFPQEICNTCQIKSYAEWTIDSSPAEDYLDPHGGIFYSSGTFTVPDGVTSITVEAWGAGGGGASSTGSKGGGGGGGGAYALATIPVNSAQSYPVAIGAGGNSGSSGGNTYFNNGDEVKAAGGSVGNFASGGPGGSIAASVVNGTATAIYAGGNGGVANNAGGGGGGSAFTNSVGGNGGDSSGNAKGTGGGGTGDGGDGGDRNNIGDPGSFPGGGGGGAGRDGGAGGSGADGLMIISWIEPGFELARSSQQNVTCNGGSDGEATVLVNDGTNPYDYVWRNSSDVEVRSNLNSSNAEDTATGLIADDYTVTVTDNDGFSSSIIVSISEPSVLSAVIGSSSASCGSSDGSLSLTSPSGGSGNYEYSINGGGSWQSSNSFTGLSAGTYNVQIRDASIPTCVQVLNTNYSLTSAGISIPLLAGANTVECQNSLNGTIDLTVPYPIQFNNPDYIDLGNMLMSNLSQFTLEGWIKVDLSTIGSRISLFGQNDAIEFGFSNSSTLDCWTASGGSVSTNVYPSDNAWHHVAAVGDGSTIILYIDGTSVATGGNSTGNYGSNTNYSSKIGAGVWDPTGGSFPGQMIKVGFWNSDLSSGEIGNLASGFYQYTGSESGLLAGFNFYDGSGTALTSVPAGNDGAFSGSPTWQDDYSYLWTKSGDAGFSATTQDLSGVEPGTYAVNVSSSSMGGCASNGSWTINYSDTTDPTAVCQDITIALDNSGNATITPSQVDSGSNDNCTPSGSLGLSLDVSSFTCSDLGNNTVTLTVTDESGNTTTCSSVVSVVDTEAPTAICQDISVTIGAGGQATVAAADVDNGSMDNCTSSGNLLFKIDGQDQLTFDCANVGVNTVTLSVEDESGNSSTCQAQVTIVNAAPSFSSCPADISVDLTSSDVGGYWQYRKPITITNSGSTLTDYQVRVDVPMETGKMNADFSDIRFRDSDGSTSLSFWLEQQDGSTAVFWVNVPSIGASKTIYVLYGNSVAISASNSSNTFIYFDDMNTATGWSDVADGGSVTTNSSEFGYNVLVKQDNDDPSGGQKSIGTTISDFKLITREQRASTGPAGASNGGSMDRYGLEDGSGNGYTLTRNADVSSTGTFGFERRTNGSASGGSASNVSQPRDNWYITELEKNGSAFSVRIYEDNHSNLLGSESGSDSNHNTFTHLTVRGGHYYYIDWMAVAKSTSAEPSLSLGGEEVLGVASCEKDVTVPLPAVFDDTGVFTLTNDFSEGPDASGTYPVGTTTVTFTATDPCGLTATCYLDVTVNDKIDPIIACGGDITADATDNPLAIPQPSFDDNCSGAVLTNDFNGTDDASGAYPVGTTTVVWTVTDASGNTATCSFDVTIDEVCAISDVSFTPITCTGDDDAAIQITATGFGQINYSIDDGESFQAGNTFSDLAAGTYNVQIADESGCTTTWPTPIIIYEANDFSVSDSVTNVSCYGNSDGAIDATLNSYLTKSIYFDGSDDYIALNQSYSGTSAISAMTVCAWVKCDPGDGGWSVLDFDRSEYFNVSLGGTNRSGSTVEFATNSDLDSGIDDMTGTINVKDGQWHHIAAVYDGTDKYLYVDGVLDSQKSNPHNGQPLGSNLTRYGFIGDGSEATGFDGGRNNAYYKGGIAQVDLWERALTADEIKQRMHSELIGFETNLAGNWSMEEGTGTSVSPQGEMINGPTWSDDIPYSYSWTKQGDGSFSANTLDISGLSAGTYNLTVTFDGACVKTTSVEVTEPDELVITPTISQISCDGLADGAIDITVAGGTEPYTFEWSTPDGSGLVTSDEDQTGLDVGTYDVTVTDGNGCVATGSYAITEPPVYRIIVSDQTNPSTCGGNDGVIELSLPNVPDGPYDITYDAGTFTGVSVSGELATISDLSAGAYNNLRLTVGTCVTSDDPDVVLTDPPTPDITELALSFSGGNDVCLDATATIEVTSSSLADGTYTLTYDLSAPNESTGETATLVFATGSGSFTTTALANTGTTILSITAIESNGCSIAASASVDILVDITPPVIATCPADDNLACVEETNAAPYVGATNYAEFVAAGGSVSDNCTIGTNLIVEFSDVTDKKDETNSCEVKRTYTITDEAGNSQTCTQTFTITDSTPPVIQDCPVDIIDFADSNCEKVMSITAPVSFTDGCGFGDLTVYHEYTINTITVNGTGDLVDVAFPKGTTVVTWSFEDECGNIGTCETEVTINDVTEPTASTPANQDLDAAGGCSVLIPDYSSLLNDLSDNCDPSPSITQEPIIGTEVFADTDIKLVFTDASGNKDSVTFTAILTNLAPLTISGMTYDGGQSGTGEVGSGQKPFITSTHTYVVDASELNPVNYTYTWLVLDQSGTDVTASISFNNTEQTSGDILFEEASVASGNTYTIRVIKEQNSGNCSAVFEFDVEVQETDFNSGVSPLGDSCQDGGTGTTTVVFWDVDFTGGVEPYAFDFTVSDGTNGCTGSVSNLYTSDSQSISTSESCNGTYVVSVTKTSGEPAVQVAFIFTNQAGIDKDFNLTIDSATDNFSITKQTSNTDENDDVTFWGVPNTSEITTD